MNLCKGARQNAQKVLEETARSTMEIVDKLALMLLKTLPEGQEEIIETPTATIHSKMLFSLLAIGTKVKKIIISSGSLAQSFEIGT